MVSMLKFIAASCAAILTIASVPPGVVAQDMTGLDTTSPAFTKSEMTRADIESGLTKLSGSEVLDLSGKSLNGLDLSGMDLRRTKLQSARINNVNFKGANLEGVVLDQAWALKSNLTGAKLKGSSLFATQFGGSKLDGADFTNAHVAADFSNASVTDAKFDGADLSADEKTNRWDLCGVPSRAPILMDHRSKAPIWLAS